MIRKIISLLLLLFFLISSAAYSQHTFNVRDASTGTRLQVTVDLFTRSLNAGNSFNMKFYEARALDDGIAFSFHSGEEPSLVPTTEDWFFCITPTAIGFFNPKTIKFVNASPVDESAYTKAYNALSEVLQKGVDDVSGAVITPEFTKAVQKYSSVHVFTEGLAAVDVWKGVHKWDYINQQGDEVIPLREATCAGVFSEGLAFIYECQSFSVIDKTGKIVFTGKTNWWPENDGDKDESLDMPYYINGKMYVDDFHLDENGENYYAVYDKKGNYIGTVDELPKDSEILKDPRKKTYTIFKESQGVFNKYGYELCLYGLKNAKGEIVIPAKYDMIYSTEYLENIELDNGIVRVGYYDMEVDENGNPAEIPDEYWGYADFYGHDTFSEIIKAERKKNLKKQYH